jgi:hypothetical protein
MANAVEVRALERALDLLGGVEALAQHLEVPARRLELWLRGSASTPPDVFLRVADLLLDRGLTQLKEETARIHLEREFGPPVEDPR